MSGKSGGGDFKNGGGEKDNRYGMYVIKKLILNLFNYKNSNTFLQY